jgi:hypothetical protein
MIAAAGKELAIRGELESGDGAVVAGERSIELISTLRHWVKVRSGDLTSDELMIGGQLIFWLCTIH